MFPLPAVRSVYYSSKSECHEELFFIMDPFSVRHVRLGALTSFFFALAVADHVVLLWKQTSVWTEYRQGHGTPYTRLEC